MEELEMAGYKELTLIAILGQRRNLGVFSCHDDEHTLNDCGAVQDERSIAHT
jgi:hypothetical protein